VDAKTSIVGALSGLKTFRILQGFVRSKYFTICVTVLILINFLAAWSEWHYGDRTDFLGVLPLGLSYLYLLLLPTLSIRVGVCFTALALFFRPRCWMGCLLASGIVLQLWASTFSQLRVSETRLDGTVLSYFLRDYRTEEGAYPPPEKVYQRIKEYELSSEIPGGHWKYEVNNGGKTYFLYLMGPHGLIAIIGEDGYWNTWG